MRPESARNSTSAPAKRKSIKFDHLLLGIIIVFFAVTNLIWLHEETVPASWDQSEHLSISLKFYRLFKSVRIFTANYSHLFFRHLDVTHFYPPFFHLTTVPWAFLFGFSPTTVSAAHFLYLALLAFSVYSIGKYFLNRWAGVGAAALTLLFPLSFGLSRTAMIDFPLMAMVTLVQYLLLKSDGGTILRWSWLLGLAAGLCALTKWTGPVFFMGTFFFIFIASRKAAGPSTRSAFLALAACFACALIVALPWFIRSFGELVRSFRYLNLIDAARRGLPEPFTLSSLIWYWNPIRRDLLSPMLFPFILVGVTGAFLWARKWKFLGFIGCWVLPAYFFLVALKNKDSRFIVPFLPAFALLTAAGLSALPWKSIRIAAWTALLLAALLQFFMMSFSWPQKMAVYGARPPLKEDWKINALLGDLENKFGRRPLIIGFLPDRPFFNPGSFKFCAELRELPYSIRALGNEPVLREQVEACDIFIIKTAKLAVPWTAVYRNQFLKEFNKRGPGAYGFEWGNESLLPDETKAVYFIKTIAASERLRR